MNAKFFTRTGRILAVYKVTGAARTLRVFTSSVETRSLFTNVQTRLWYRQHACRGINHELLAYYSGDDIRKEAKKKETP
jgi:hypothetical protein